MISELNMNWLSNETVASKINECVRALNAAELAATDSQHIKPNMPVFAEVKAAVEREVHGPLSSVEESIAFVVYNFLAWHVGH